LQSEVSNFYKKDAFSLNSRNLNFSDIEINKHFKQMENYFKKDSFEKVFDEIRVVNERLLTNIGGLKEYEDKEKDLLKVINLLQEKSGIQPILVDEINNIMKNFSKIRNKLFHREPPGKNDLLRKAFISLEIKDKRLFTRLEIDLNFAFFQLLLEMNKI
jgi:hypothetical protein